MIKFILCHIESYDLIEFKNLWSKDFGKVPWTKNKYLEMEVLHDGTLLAFDLDLHYTGTDHAGPSLSISFMTLTFTIRIYDHRHWNLNTNDWCVYDKDGNELDEDGKPIIYAHDIKNWRKNEPT